MAPPPHQRPGTCLCPRILQGAEAGCSPLTICGTPRVPEYEAAKIRKAMQRCTH